MYKLCLIRHAKARWNMPSATDFERTLTDQGQLDAKTMGKALKQRHFMPQMIITSQALRAQHTGKIIADVLTLPANKIIIDKGVYEGSVDNLMEITHLFDSNLHSVIMVGHNPGITMFASILTGEYIDTLEPGGLCCLEFKCNSWDDINCTNCIVQFVDKPKNH